MQINQSYALGEYSTVFHTEVYRILKVAEQFEERSNSCRSICICSNSQAALRAISHPRADSGLRGCSREAGYEDRSVVTVGAGS